MSDIKELIASKLRPIANAVRTKSGKTELIPVDDLEDEILALPDTEALRQSLKQIIEKTGTSYEIPYGIKKIGTYSFYKWVTLQSVEIPESVEDIDAYAFGSCSVLTDIIIPNSVKTIGESCFNYCKALKNIIIPNSVTSLGKAVFSYSGITEIEIPESITEIPQQAFSNASITKCILPATITSIGTGAFGGTNKFTDLYFKGSLKQYMDIPFAENAVPFHQIMGNLHILNKNGKFELVENLVIPDDVTTISTYKFYRCKSILTVDLNKVQKIEKMGLAYGMVKRIYIPDSVTEIDNNAFQSQGALEEIVFGENVESIGTQAVYGTASNCIVVMKPTTPPTLGTNNFSTVAKIFVPLGTRNTYVSKTNWSALASKIFEPNTINISIPSQLLNNENYTYSIDGSPEFNQFTNSAITLENVATVKIKNLDANTTILVGTTEGGSDIGTIANAELTYATSGNQTIYLTVA